MVLTSRASASARGRLAGEGGRSGGGRRTMMRRSRRCGMPSSAASTGSIRPPCTALGIPRSWWGGCCGSCRGGRSGRSSSPSVGCRGTSGIGEAPKRDLRPEVIRNECEASLKRLGVERIDLYQFHWPDESGTPVEESWQEMAKLADEGKVRWIGVSNFNADLLARCEAIRHVDSLQAPFSLIRREIAARELAWCREHGTGVIVYSPMQSGLLTEKWTLGRVFALAGDDWRRGSAEVQQPNVERNLALRDALVPIAKKYNVSTGAVAIAWTLAWPGVTGAIVGGPSPG